MTQTNNLGGKLIWCLGSDIKIGHKIYMNCGMAVIFNRAQLLKLQLFTIRQARYWISEQYFQIFIKWTNYKVIAISLYY